MLASLLSKRERTFRVAARNRSLLAPPTMHQLILAARFRLVLRILLRHPPRNALFMAWELNETSPRTLMQFYLISFCIYCWWIVGCAVHCVAECRWFFLARSKEKKAHFVVGRDGDDRREDDRVIRDFSPLLAILWFDFRLQNLKALTSCAEELAAWLLHNRGVALFETLPCSMICIQKKFQCCKAGDFNKVVSL